MKKWRKHSQKPDALDPTLSLDELAWRIGASEIRPVTSDPALAGSPEGLDDVFIGLGPTEATDITRALAGPTVPAEPVATGLVPPLPAMAVPSPAEPADIAEVAAAAPVAVDPVFPNADDDVPGASATSVPHAADPPPAAEHSSTARPMVALTAATPQRKLAPVPRGIRHATDSSWLDAAMTAVRTPGSASGRNSRSKRVKAGIARRTGIWRDTSAVLIGVVGIVLIAQLALANPGGDTAQAASTPQSSPIPSEVAMVPSVPPPTITPPSLGPTLGPVIDPSLIPAIEATPNPSPSPTPAPTPTPRITPRPTVKPTPKPTPTPTPPPAHAVIASPNGVACYVAGLNVSFSAAGSTGATSYTWNFDDGGTGPSSSKTASHIYESPGTYGVILTVSGPRGVDFASVTIAVQASCP